MSPGQQSEPPRGRFTIVYLIHEAFRRDLRRLRDAVGSVGTDSSMRQRLNAHWGFVNEQLHHHHRVEDESLWPLVLPKLADSPDDLAVLERMEAQHVTLQPECEAISEGFAAWSGAAGADGGSALVGHLDGLQTLLSSHLDDEETHAFPVIDRALNHEEFESFGKATAKAVGIRGSARFFPWIFDGAAPVERAAVLRMPPPPVRVLCGYVWEPRYQRQSSSLWGS